MNRARLLAACFREGVDQLARFQLRRIQDHRLAGFPELVQIVAANILILDVENARPFPFAEWTEAHVTNDSLERTTVQIVGELALIDPADCFHGLTQNLQFGVSKWRPEAERIRAGACSALLITFQHV